ncbi:hypothetical protein MRX96_050336 [Rhipicephalus microplus]
MYLQVLLFAVVGQLSSASSDGLPTTVTEDSGVCSGTPLSSFSTHHSPFFRVSDGLPPNLDFTVFAVRQHGATSADPPLQKRAGCIDTSGHGTAAADRRSPIVYLQEQLLTTYTVVHDRVLTWPEGVVFYKYETDMETETEIAFDARMLDAAKASPPSTGKPLQYCQRDG